MRACSRAPLAWVLVAAFGPGLFLPASWGTAQRYRKVAFRLPGVPTAMAWRDLEGDGRKELLIEDLRAVHLYRPLTGEAPGKVHQTLACKNLGFLYDLKDLDGDGALEFLMVKAGGVHVLRLEDGRFAASETPQVRIRRTYTPSRPLRVDLASDVDGDGNPDLVYPAGDRFRLFPGDGKGGFDARRVRSLPSGIRIVVRAPAAQLDGQLESTFQIPKLISRDVDGDGHPDLLAQQGRRLDIYRGGEGWKFAEKATWVLDLARFETGLGKDEEGRKVRIEIGTVNLSQDDLDGDGVRDFLVAAGRKVWIFFGGKGFTGFDRPDRILRVGEDIAAVFTGDVDGDDRADLILVKFVMPGVARLVAALLVGIDLRIEALAYRNHGDRTLSRKPDRTNRISFSVPPILSLLSDLSSLEKKMDTAKTEARRLRVGDFNGDGVYDIGIRSGPHRLDLYACTGAGALAGGIQDREVVNRLIRDLLFDTRRREWDIDRLMEYAGDFRYSLNRDRIEGRKPVATVALRSGTFRESDFRFMELDGDGKADIVVFYDTDKNRLLDLHLSSQR